MQKKFRIKPVGDQAALVVFEQKIEESVNTEVMELAARIERAGRQEIVETVPAFASLLVYYDPLRMNFAECAKFLEKLASRRGAGADHKGKLVEIPVCYGGIYGEDLEYVAKHANMTTEEVIRIHSGREYRIYMLGFLPGFPYLGGMDERLATPRLSSPRTKIPAGSVGIGGSQTGIYPVSSPGGWQLIGRTPVTLFSSGKGGTLPYEAGDRIRFVPISEEEYLKRSGIEKKAES